MGIVYWLNWIGIGCWIVCFWWMHSLSRRQEAILHELQQQAKRIEYFSKQEHDLIQEVHPAVNQIRDEMEEVVSTLEDNGAGKKRGGRRG
jgi:hypothetical protein